MADPPSPAAAEASATTTTAVPSAAPAAEANAAATHAKPVTGATPSTAAAPAKTATNGNENLSQEREAHFRKEGYTVETINGEKAYCKTGDSTSSRIKHKHCYTEEVLVRSENINPNETMQKENCPLAGCTK
jgi:hypothetical protein